MKITAVVPVWNESEERLTGVLKDLRGFVDEVVVVDDGSSEPISNKQLAINKEKGFKIYLLRHRINRGQGAALQTGTDFALKKGADIVVHFDSDGQHQAKDVPGLVKPILEGKADYVFGSKMLGSYKDMPWTKRWIFWPVSKVVDYVFTGLWLTDVHSGSRAFHKSVADKLYLAQDKMAHATEYSYLVRKNKIRYTEAPVEILYHKYGRAFGEAFRILKDLVLGKCLKAR